MLTELVSRSPFSTRIADSVPRKLVEFKGLDQDQGSWQWCIDFNRRLMPSLTPIDLEAISADSENNYFSILKSWKSFQKLQQYTDGEAFFLCYPAAFMFGMYAKYGLYDESLLRSWSNSYLRDQIATQEARENEGVLYSSTKFDRRLRNIYSVHDQKVGNSKDLIKLLSEISSAHDLQVVQISCNYPMFGNKRFGHYLSIVDTDKTPNGFARIAGSLAPFGIYETPTAEVRLNELARFAEISNKLLLRSARTTSIDLQDRTKESGIQVISLSPKQVERT